MKTSPNYKNIQQRLLLIVSIFLNTLLFAQTYPVQVNPQLIPPYSLKISDYATTTSEKLYLNILLTDVNEVGRRVRLKMYIEGQGLAISTQEVIMGETPIFLNGGINTRLSNVDLQAYFQLNNLIGITPQQFNNPLPNGGYDFCFEVYDYFTNRKLSGKSCTTAYLLQNDPPILNLPFKNNIVTATNPQNILFTWTPRHTNANNVQYEYTLKELWDVQNPQASFLASIPFYQTTTYNTTLLVGPEAPQLMSGKIYGWQVRAFVSDGINETSVFKNDGKSEIFWFKYLKDCSAPSFVISQALTAESVQINWQASAHIRYRIQYRKKGFGDDDWFDVNTYTNEGKIFNLEADTVYEFRVGGECTQLSGFAYSNIQEFTTPTNDEAAYYNCGLTPEINITNNDLLPKLGVNETFTAGDFPVITRKVTGSNGTFSGWGYITLPFLENIKEIIDAVNILTDDGTEEKKGNINIGKYTRIKVTFSGISINTSYELTKGLVQTDYDPEWGGILDLDAVIDDVFGDDGETNSFDASNIDIKTVTVNADGAIVITTENGETQIITSDKPVTITDKNGDQWTVKEDGTVIKGKVAEGGVPTKNNTEGISSAGNVTEISSKDVRVKFIPSGYYSNDTHNESITSSKYKKQYEFVKTHDDKEYSVLYKLISDVSSNKTDVVKAEVSFANGKTKKDIVFKTKQGVKIDSSWSDNVVTLKLKREFEFAKDEIIATVKPKDSTKKHTVAGKLNIWHAQQRSINLTLVSVDGASTDGVGDRINEIYNKAGVNFNITSDNLTLGLKKLDVGDSDMISNYTQGQKNIISAYKSKAKKDQYYIFFLDNEKVTLIKDLEGFMPLKRQFGFVFTKQDAGRVAAHEIGHGIFGLKHPWDQYNTKKGESTYLMDSGTSGTDFTHMDWQKLHAPGIQLYIFQGDEAGESVIVKSIPKKFWNLDKITLTFMTLNGSYITLPNRVEKLRFTSGLDHFDKFVDFPIGALIGFNLDNVTYKATTTRNSKLENITKDDLTYTYKGFKSLKDKHFYGSLKDELDYNKFDDGKVIALIPHYTTTYNDKYRLSGSVKSGYLLIKIPRADISFSPKHGEEVSFNLLDDYTNISKFFSGYTSNPKTTIAYSYNETPFNSQFELQEKYVNPILENFSWTNKHALLAKYAILNNAQPELFKSYFEKKYGEESYTNIFSKTDITKLKEIYLDLINSFSREKENLIKELHNLLANTDIEIDKSSIIAVESVRINEILKQLTTEQIKDYIYPTERKKALNLLLFANREMRYEKGVGIVNEYDEQIIKLIKFTKDIERKDGKKDDREEMFISLTKNNYYLFWKSIKKLEEKNVSVFLNLYTQYVNENKNKDPNINERIKYRTDILTKLSESKEDDWGNKTEKVFASIISNLEGRSKDQADLVKYFESNPEVIKDAFIALDNFVKVDELANFIFTICSWKVKFGNTSGINEVAFKEYHGVDYLAGSNYDEVKHIKPISTEHNYIPYFRESWIKSVEKTDNYYLETKFSGNNINLELTRYLHNIIKDTYSPLEYVYVHFREDSSYKEHKFKKGTGLRVPAIFIHWLDDSVDDDQNLALARIAANIMAIAAAPSTFGASIAPFIINVEIAANLIDIYVTVNRQELIDSGSQDDLAYWDAAMAIYSLKDLPNAIKGLGKTGKGLINIVNNIGGAIKQNRTLLKPNNLDNAVDAFHAIKNNTKKEEVIKVLDRMLYVLKYKNPQKLDPVSKLINYRTYFKLRTKLATEFKKGAPKIFDLERSGVDFKPSLVYNNGSSKVNLGKLEFDSNNTIVLSNSNRFLPPGITNTEELATIQNVLVKTAAGSKGINNVSIVKNLDNGEVYVKLAGTPGVDISGYKVPELVEIMEKLNPEGLTKNCFTVALKYQHETHIGIETVIEEIAQTYRNGVDNYKVPTYIKKVFGEANMKSYPSVGTYDDLMETLKGIQQERVFLNGGLRESGAINGLDYHVFNARKKNGNWEVVDLQNGTRYDKEFIDRVFINIDIHEVLYPDYTYPSRIKLKQVLSVATHQWIDEIPNDFLKVLESLPNTELEKFVNDFDNNYTKLSEFNKDPILYEIWKTFDKKDYPFKNNIEALKKAKPVFCKFKN